ADTVTRLPGDLLPWFEGWVGAALLAMVGLAIGLVIALRPGVRGAIPFARVIAEATVTIVVGGAAGTSATAAIAGPLTLPADWSVVACDIGQGDAVLLRSAGSVALIDTGPEPAPLASCLSRVGVERIDLLVLTHFDLDHVGGAEAVRGRVGTVLHGPPADVADERLLRDLADGGARVVSAAEGLTGRLGDAQWRVLWPRGGSRAFPSGNDASIVVDVRGGGIPSMLLLGDLSASPQAALAASALLAPPYAVVKVAHHGSADQDAALYAAADPSIALVTVGADNDYGHPRDEILDIVSGLGARVARTDTQGLVALSLRGDEVSVWRERVGGGD
ncbi:MAG: MBL fold metallo-hydrolase, partial [Microbacterium sp.]